MNCSLGVLQCCTQCLHSILAKVNTLAKEKGDKQFECLETVQLVQFLQLITVMSDPRLPLQKSQTSEISDNLWYTDLAF